LPPATHFSSASPPYPPGGKKSPRAADRKKKNTPRKKKKTPAKVVSVEEKKLKWVSRAEAKTREAQQLATLRAVHAKQGVAASHLDVRAKGM
jgi:hypothetical protein